MNDWEKFLEAATRIFGVGGFTHYGRTGGDGLVRYGAVHRGEDVAGAAGRTPANR